MSLKFYGFVLFMAIKNLIIAQKPNWQLPKHQISASVGRIQSPTNEVKMMGGGIAYTFHFTKKWWASAEWQTGYKSTPWLPIDLADYRSWDDVSQTFSRNFTELPVYQYTGARYGVQPAGVDVVTGAPIAKVPSSGYYDTRNYGLLIGYMITSPKNILRLGAGFSMNETKERLIRRLPQQNGFPYLLELTNRQACYNATLQYDYYLWRGLSVGMRLLATVEMRMPEPSHYSALLSVGYSLPNFKKKKVRV
jgi:hypothetical protein